MKMQTIKKHIMTGISFLIPMVVMAGIVGAVQKAFSWSGVSLSDPLISGLEFSGYSITKLSDFMAVMGKMNSFGFNWAYAFLCAGIAFSIADRPGIVPGFAIGYFAGGPTKTGFIGAMLMGFLVGYFVLWMKTWKVPKALRGLMPVLVIPVLATMVASFVFFGILMRPISYVMIAFQNWIQGLAEGSLFVVGAVIGACMGFDMGGPVNKTASMAANGLGADGIYGPMSAKIIGGMTPPCGVFIASLIAKDKFTQTERDTAITAFPMGLCFITEGVLPFAAGDPLHFIPASMIGSAVAGAIAVGMGVESMAGHGGIFVFPAMANPLWAVVALIVGSVVTGVIYAIIKKKPEEAENVEEEVTDDLDIDF